MRSLAKRLVPTLILVLAVSSTAVAQNSKQIDDQRKKIADLERKIAEEDRNIKKIKSDKSSAQQRVISLSKQIQRRNDLLDANERQSRLLQHEVDRTDSTANALTAQLAERRGKYAAMVRESYRNYRNDNYMYYILTSGGFREMAHRIALLREVAVRRGESIAEIKSLTDEVAVQQAELAKRQAELDSVKRRITDEKSRIQKDVNSAQASVKQLNSREKQALKNRSEQERRLSLARDELQKLTKGNTVGNSFSRTSKIDLPVEGGTRGRIIGGVCEIMGKRNARVTSVYDGKVIAVKAAGNNRYEVYVAHGERVSSYSNLSEVTVKLNQTVKRNQQIGVIGSWVNPLKSEPEYKILFQLQSPSSNETYSLEKMFGK